MKIFFCLAQEGQGKPLTLKTFRRDPYPKQLDGILILPWEQGVLTYFGQQT